MGIDEVIIETAMSMSAASIQSQASTMVLKHTMDASEEISSELIKQLANSAPAPRTGHIDISI